jgi:predicted DCC family thiol-disulfide oxidoreductase YuxK
MSVTVFFDGECRLCSQVVNFLLVPRAVRDFLYRVVARFRFQIWGKLSQCRVPSPERRNGFCPRVK